MRKNELTVDNSRLTNSFNHTDFIDFEENIPLGYLSGNRRTCASKDNCTNIIFK